MAKTMMTLSLSLSFTANLSRTTGSRAWKMCAPVVMDVIPSDILVIIITMTTSTPIMVIISLKLMLRDLHLPHGRFGRERGAHTLMTRAACSHGAEGTMGSFALDHDDLPRLYPTLFEIGRWAINALVLALTLPVFVFRTLHLAFPQHTLSDNGLRYTLI